MKGDVDIQSVALAFRSAFEGVELHDAPGSLPIFPQGCCSWATWMLGHYLKLELSLDPQEIEAQRTDDGGQCAHAWLGVSGLTVDITADQFPDGPARVVVAAISPWHARWNVIRVANIRPISFVDSCSMSGYAKPSEIYERLAVHVRSRLPNPFMQPIGQRRPTAD